MLSSPNLTKKFQWEVSQIADNRLPLMMLLGGLSVNLNHLIKWETKHRQGCQTRKQNKVGDGYTHWMRRSGYMSR